MSESFSLVRKESAFNFKPKRDWLKKIASFLVTILFILYNLLQFSLFPRELSLTHNCYSANCLRCSRNRKWKKMFPSSLLTWSLNFHYLRQKNICSMEVVENAWFFNYSLLLNPSLVKSKNFSLKLTVFQKLEFDS